MLGTACSDPGEEVTTTGSPGGGDGPLFVSIEVGGGFVPQGYDFRQPPTAVVYSNGRSFTTGAITLQYPGPAVLPVTEGQLTAAQVGEILEAAEEAGLTGEPRDYGQPPVADAPTTTITVVTDGETHTASIEALQEASTDMPQSDELPPGMTQESVEARRAARKFVDLVGSMTTRGESEAYEPDRYRALPLAIDQNAPPPDDGSGIEPQVKDWPFPQIALVANECAVITGPDAPTFRQALQGANELTRWRTQSGELFNLAVRPVLPHEPDCPEEQKPKSGAAQ